MENKNEEGLAVPTPGGTLLDIRELSIQCRQLLHQFSTDDSPDEGAEARELMASFNIWVANMGVFHEGRQSVASRLRSAPQISELTQQLLVVLKHDLEKGVLRGDKPEEDQSASESDDSSDRSSAPSYRLLEPSDDDEGYRLSASSSPNTWTSIRNTITSLRPLALTLRLAGAQHRQEQIRHFKNLDRNKQVYQLFERCARRRVDWLFPKSSKTLRERMAESVATRRARFLYLEEHQENISTLNEPAPMPQQKEGYGEKEKLGALPVVQPGQQQQGTVRPSVQSSVIQSTKTVTKLDPEKLYPARSNIKPAESVSSVKIPINKFPLPPTLDPGGTSFTCPYCFLVCPAIEASGPD
ncbi:hypothetical protein LY78DRAFT_107567 [Colletotrichum sublineola]|nr:hypothetical protein LY78DRAFT_107567 [Colletotrichum sublineola]